MSLIGSNLPRQRLGNFDAQTGSLVLDEHFRDPARVVDVVEVIAGRVGEVPHRSVAAGLEILGAFLQTSVGHALLEAFRNRALCLSACCQHISPLRDASGQSDTTGTLRDSRRVDRPCRTG